LTIYVCGLADSTSILIVSMSHSGIWLIPRKTRGISSGVRGYAASPHAPKQNTTGINICEIFESIILRILTLIHLISTTEKELVLPFTGYRKTRVCKIGPPASWYRKPRNDFLDKREVGCRILHMRIVLVNIFLGDVYSSRFKPSLACSSMAGTVCVK
jgi:hypothetical protein